MSHKNIVVGYIKHKGDKMGQLFAKIMSHKNIFVEYLKVIRWYNYLLESVTCLVGHLKVKRLSNFKEKVQKIVFFSFFLFFNNVLINQIILKKRGSLSQQILI